MTSTVNHDYWALLGLPPESSLEQLKRAFRREARRWHPDLNLNDINAEERFKLVNEAYAILTDPIKKAAWENARKLDLESQVPFSTGFPTLEEYLNIVLGVEIVDEHNEFDSSIDDTSSYEWPKPFQDNQQSPLPVQIHQDIETLVELSPDQSLNGAEVELELEDGTIVAIKTPPLAGDGWRLRLAGVAKGGKDHFIQLRVMTNEGLRIDGLRVLYRLEIFPPDAVLGCAVDVPTLDGPVTLQVPPGSSSGRLLRLRGRGLELDDMKGDQLVEIVVVIPSELGDSERALYGRLQELSLDSE